MQITLQHNGEAFIADLSLPIDLSISMGNKEKSDVRCYFADPFESKPVKGDGWEGTVKSGFPVNFYSIKVNPHGNGTHTECYGHIDSDMPSVSDQLKQFHFVGQVISLIPETIENGDQLFTKKSLTNISIESNIKAIIIRSLPNDDSKLYRDYSGSNPPYFDAQLLAYFKEIGIEHILVDTPSMDKESDGGLLLGHRAFWGENENLNPYATITELIFVPNNVNDGLYLINLQLAPIELDASPSRPVIYSLNKK